MLNDAKLRKKNKCRYYRNDNLDFFKQKEWHSLPFAVVSAMNRLIG
jgi:hypothetical protein